MYKNIDEKLQLSERLKKVEEGVRARVLPKDFREITLIDPIPCGGRDPFADVLKECLTLRM